MCERVNVKECAKIAQEDFLFSANNRLKKAFEIIYEKMIEKANNENKNLRAIIVMNSKEMYVTQRTVSVFPGDTLDSVESGLGLVLTFGGNLLLGEELLKSYFYKRIGCNCWVTLEFIHGDVKITSDFIDETIVKSSPEEDEMWSNF